MKKSLGRLTVVLLLVLSGCSVHFHGEAESGSKSSETSGEERADDDKKKDKDKRDRDKKDDDKKDDDKKDDGKKDDDKKDDGKKDDGKKDDGKKDDDKKDDDKKDDDKKDDKPSPETGGGASKPSAGEGIGNVGTGAIKPGGSTGGGSTGGGSTGGGSTGGTTGVDPGKGAVNVGINTIRIKPDKGVAQGGRGDPVTPSEDASETTKPNTGGATDDKVKPDKSDSKGSRAGAVAMQPGRSVPGLGTINKPIPVTGFDCKLASKTAKKGANLTIKGRGFDESTKVLISGTELEVRSRTKTKLVAKLPKELENGGDVTLKQGDLVASCGKLEIK